MLFVLFEVNVVKDPPAKLPPWGAVFGPVPDAVRDPPLGGCLLMPPAGKIFARRAGPALLGVVMRYDCPPTSGFAILFSPTAIALPQWP
jgi:hypothetical protein